MLNCTISTPGFPVNTQQDKMVCYTYVYICLCMRVPPCKKYCIIIQAVCTHMLVYVYVYVEMCGDTAKGPAICTVSVPAGVVPQRS